MVKKEKQEEKSHQLESIIGKMGVVSPKESQPQGGEQKNSFEQKLNH